MTDTPYIIAYRLEGEPSSLARDIARLRALGTLCGVWWKWSKRSHRRNMARGRV